MRRRRVTVEFNISGRAMAVIEGSDLYEQPDKRDPHVAEASEALRHADVARRGTGVTHFVRTTPGAAQVIMDYCVTVGDMLRGSSDPDSQRDCFALRVVADRIHWRLKELAEAASAGNGPNTLGPSQVPKASPRG